MTELADALFVHPEMARIWSGEMMVRYMCAFEAALARAEAQTGVIPQAAAEAIAAACVSGPLDVPAIFREAALAGTPAIPLVRMLEERVEAAARGYVHWGATSQDVIDTALVLQMRDGLGLLRARMLALGDACAALADEHRHTLMVGRTLLQQALPITFGLKAARWLALTTRQVRALVALRGQVSVVQCGGAAGTLAALGAAGLRVTDLLAAELGLAVPELPWHTERDRVAAVAAGLGVLAGAMAKIAQDVVLLAQSEVGEVSEASAEGKGGSSALPQKHNPVDAVAARAAARLAIGVVPVVLGAMAQEHERAAGAWQAEWEALPQLFRYTSGAVDHVVAAIAGLRVHDDRLRENLAAARGLVLAEALVMALAPTLGRRAAQRVVRDIGERAGAAGIDLREAARQDERVHAALPAEALDRVFDPMGYLGSTDAYIERALADYRALRSEVKAS
ncbi:MAG TPA: 3-carboxy-cis,cis-muconate cycloisomerase [Ktedonobacterales bacterium]